MKLRQISAFMMLYRFGIQPGKDRTNSPAMAAAWLTAAAGVKVISSKTKSSVSKQIRAWDRSTQMEIHSWRKEQSVLFIRPYDWK
ncbi:hypothetical protein CEXT_369181 [Caerostris extrusa]|uniref:Uncharacterized protein n=1 Tax=Caerostris extrusa TaxID=172846 RepID=A0AAV4XK48_CAEEX|nr:hypothetical protein CEXT_369181 [Caerostris extrusa]